MKKKFLPNYTLIFFFQNLKKYMAKKKYEGHISKFCSYFQNTLEI